MNTPSWFRSLFSRKNALIIGLNLGMTVLKTFMHGKAYQAEGFSPSDQRLLYVQEWTRQSISTVLWLVSLVASAVVTRKLFPKHGELQQVLITNLISSVPDALVRPFLTAKISKLFLNRTGAAAPTVPNARALLQRVPERVKPIVAQPVPMPQYPVVRPYHAAYAPGYPSAVPTMPLYR